MNAEDVIERVELELLRSLPSGVNDAYARSFFRRNRAWMLARLEEVVRAGLRTPGRSGSPARTVRPVPTQSGLRIRLADMVEAMQVEGLPAQLEARTITAALEAAMADFGVRATVGSENSQDGRRFYRARVNRPEEAPVLAAFWEDTIPLNGVWQGSGELNPAVEVAGFIARQLLRLHDLKPDDAPDAEGWSAIFSGVLLEKALVANASLPTVVLRSPVAKGLLWRIQNAYLYTLKGLLPSAEVHFRVAEDGSLADIRDEVIPGGLDERYTLIVDGAPYRTVTLVHPLDLPAGELEQWQRLFRDYEILQPFPQLHRTIDRRPPAERADWLKTVIGRRVQKSDSVSIPLRFRQVALRVVLRVVDRGVAEVRIADVIGGHSVGAVVLAELSVRDWSEVVRAVEGVVE